jgi:hypothetical protein
VRVDEIAEFWAALKKLHCFFAGERLGRRGLTIRVVFGTISIWDIMNHSVSADEIRIPCEDIIKNVEVRIHAFASEEDKYAVRVIPQIMSELLAVLPNYEALIRSDYVVWVIVVKHKSAENIRVA